MEDAARPGIATATLGGALVLTAGLLDAEPLYVPGIAFLALAMLAAGWVVLGARGVRIDRTVGARRVLEEEPVPVTITVTSPRPLPTGAVLDALLPGPAPLAAGRRAMRVRINVRFARRGRRVLEGPRVAIRDPFGLVTRVVSGAHPVELLVLPRTDPVLTPQGEGEGSAAARRGRPSIAAEVELDGLREHRPGTPASRIFWPALARRQPLMERRLRADSDTRPLVLLDPRGAAALDDEDAAVRAAASLAMHFAAQGGCALLIPGDRRPAVLEPGLANWPHVHARLAVVDGSMPPALAGLATRRGPLLYVAARRLTAPPRALAHAPGGGRILVVPGPIPGRHAAFTVAGCIGYELSDMRTPGAEAAA